MMHTVTSSIHVEGEQISLTRLSLLPEDVIRTPPKARVCIHYNLIL